MTERRASIAKISAPRLFGVVARQRLFARLDEERGRPLVWIEGPPGAGKTTLVATWLENHGRPSLWYQVDAGDADPANLFHYLAVGAATLVGDVAPKLPRLLPEHGTDLTAFARLFFRAFFAALPPGLVLVLDNVQEVGPGAVFHEIVRTLVREAPPEDGVVCVSRAGPPPALLELLATNALARVPWETLRLSLDETRAMLEAGGVHDDWLVRALHEQSGGWAAGITLMLARLQDGEGRAGALPADSLESVFDYFATLLFDDATPTVRAVLLSVAHLAKVTPSAAVALSGEPGAGTVLERLFERRLFVDRRAGDEPVFELHALLRTFLQSQAAARFDAAALAALKRSTARESLRLGDGDTAFRMFVALSDWHAASTLCLDAAPEQFAAGRRTTIEGRIGAIPVDVRDRHPRLWYWLGRAQIATRPIEAMGTLEQALACAKAIDDEETVLLCLESLLGLFNIGHLGMGRGEQWVAEALARLERVEASRPDHWIARFWGSLASAVFYVQPWHPMALALPRRFADCLDQPWGVKLEATAIASALNVCALTGQFDLGERMMVAARRFLDAPDSSPSETAWLLFTVSYFRFLQARYDECLDLLHKAEAVAASVGLREAFGEIVLYRFMVEFRLVGWTIACETLSQMENLPTAGRPLRLALIRTYQARRATWQGDVAKAADLSLDSYTATAATGSLHQRIVFGLINAELLLQDGRLDPARAWIAEAEAIIVRAPAEDCWRAPLMLTQAYLAFVTAGPHAALAPLRAALEASQIGNRRYFLRYQECCMAALFPLALESGIEVAFVQSMVRLFRLPPPATASELWPRRLTVRCLGGFVVQVDGAPLAFSRKVPKKTLALLKALVVHGGREVGEEFLCDALWGDEEADAARQALSVTIARLRKLLGIPELVSNRGGKIGLDRTLCDVDAWRFEALLEGDPAPEAWNRALPLYAGVLLPEDEGEPWCVAARERLRGKFIHALAARGRQLESTGDPEDAARLFQRGIDADPVVDTFHTGLMRCYRRMGRHAEAISAYRRLRQTLSVVLGVAPPPEAERLFRDICNEMAIRATPGHDSP